MNKCSADHPEQRTRLAEARKKALDFIQTRASGAIGYAEYLLRQGESQPRISKNKHQIHPSATPVAQQAYSARLLIESSRLVTELMNPPIFA
jgi:hypothetical protein